MKVIEITDAMILFSQIVGYDQTEVGYLKSTTMPQ